MKSLDLGVRVIELRLGWASDRTRVYESVNVLGGSIRTYFFPQCIMKACRTGRFNFYPPSCIHSRHYLAFKLRHSVRHMSSSFSLMHIATNGKKIGSYGLMFFDFQTKTPVSIILYACLYSTSEICVDEPKESLKTQFICQLSLISVVSYSHADSVAVRSNHFLLVE